MRAVDTNVLVRLITRDDPRQTRSADEFVAGGAWVSMLVLMETVWVLRTLYGVNSTDLATVIQMLLDHRELVLHESETVAAALELFRSKPSLGFSDCLVIESARKAGHLPLGTFDRNLSRVEGAHKL
jgi:predicted nucleic-acid-binding protein